MRGEAYKTGKRLTIGDATRTHAQGGGRWHHSSDLPILYVYLLIPQARTLRRGVKITRQQPRAGRAFRPSRCPNYTNPSSGNKRCTGVCRLRSVLQLGDKPQIVSPSPLIRSYTHKLPEDRRQIESPASKAKDQGCLHYARSRTLDIISGPCPSRLRATPPGLIIL